MRMIALRPAFVLMVLAGNIHADEAMNRARMTLFNMQSVGTVIEAYRADAGSVPAADTVEAMRLLLSPTYIRDLPVRDGWGTPFRYVRTGEQSFQIISAGADKTFDQKTWTTYAETRDLSADAVYVTATTEPGSFQRRWTDEAGKPLVDRTVAETRRRIQPEIDVQMQKMKGMTPEQSFSQIRTSSTTRIMGAMTFALESFKEKHGGYPKAASMSELEQALVPQFTSGVSRRDAWGTEFRYIASENTKTYRLISAGADETFDDSSWSRRGALRSADEDAVVENGDFVRRWDERTQPGLTPRKPLPPSARASLDEADQLKEEGSSKKALPAAPTNTAPLRITSDGDVRAPVVVSRVEPVIPDTARQARIAGIIILEILIDKTGRVREATVLKPLPYGLNEAAVEAVKQWKFRPATRNGEPVDVIFNVTVLIKAPAPPA